LCTYLRVGCEGEMDVPVVGGGGQQGRTIGVDRKGSSLIDRTQQYPRFQDLVVRLRWVLVGELRDELFWPET
jgi:hypothetical protein